jgi:hypothetical protein
VAHLQPQRIRILNGGHFGVLDDLRPGLLRRASQPGDHFAGINGTARHGSNNFQIAGIVPANR